MSLTRADLDPLPSYVPGRTVPGAIKLASNEVPYGPLPGVAEAIAEAAANTHRYPDAGTVALRDALGTRYGVDPIRVVSGCGSVALAEHLARVTCREPDDEVLYAWRSFEMYPILTATAAAASVKVPNRADHAHDLAAMAAALSPRTRLVFVCNPNNPTGTAVRAAELDAFLDAVPETTLVVLDEAYREFVTDPGVPDGLAYADRPNVAVLRTLSKAWGLAGLRVGFLIAQPGVADAMRKVVTPFSTSHLAQAAALAALGQDAEMSRRAALVVRERERVLTALHKLIPDVPESHANFVWLPLGDRSAAFGAVCEEHLVIVRVFAGDGVRVSIGTPEENDAFLAAAEAALT
ncbi:MAG TPA: histidinol-phosphate transaminase [Rugosimonospora sp.]|nr:histidinol-phosphate transaminase [Rugosimonospora sp.]